MKLTKPLLKFLCLICAKIVWVVESYEILVFHSLSTSSHRTAIWPLVEKLADQGHNVIYIFPVTKRLGNHPNVTEIAPSKMVPILKDFVSEFDINIRLQNKVDEWFEEVLETSFKLCEAFYDSPEIKELLSKPNLHFDLLLIDGCLGECAYGLVHRFQAKFILFISFFTPYLGEVFGIVPESSSTPDFLFHAKPNEMNLPNRMMTTLIPLLSRRKVLQYMGRLEPVIRKGLNAPDLPPLTDIEQNTSLVMLNNYFVEDYPLSLPPMFVSYSGLWCSREKLQTRKPVPDNIAKFIEKSRGFFYISFGSAIGASAMPPQLRNHFFNAFRVFPEYRFLWRWTGPVPEDTPNNTMLFPWFPQHDILAHPMIKAFVTQSGKSSTQEALCHAVPLITMPIITDQDYNADRMEYHGATINLDITKVTTHNLRNSFKEILENPKYRDRMKQLSIIFRDRPIDPLDNALYWTEYVMRHNSTEILKPLAMTQKQTWYQRRLLDVYAAFCFIGLVLLSLLSYVRLIFLRLIARVMNSVTNEKTKVN